MEIRVQIQAGDWIKYKNGDMECYAEVLSICTPFDGGLFYQTTDLFVSEEHILEVRHPEEAHGE